MKILKYVVGIVALLFLGFLAIGFFTPQINYSSEVEVDKPIKEAWAVFADESRLHEWLPSYKGMELIDGEMGQEGSKYTVKMENEGEAFEMTETVTTIKKEEHYGMHFDSDMMEQDLNVFFTAKDDNTTLIRADGEVRGKGMMMRSMFAMMKGSFKKSNDELYGNLKTLIEENTVDYFPPPPPPVEAGAAEAEGETEE